MIPASLSIAGALITLTSLALWKDRLPKRRNFTGAAIPTASGLLFIPIILLTFGVALSAGIVMGRSGILFLIYLFLAVAVGYVDDAHGGSEARGFRGHLGALLRGRVTTGTLKVLVLGGGALVLGVAYFGFRIEALLSAYLISGSANLANLFDVRPGRALKFVGAPVLLLLFVAPREAEFAVLPVVGGVISLFYFDVRGRIMLGDAGAAACGAVMGYLVVACGPGLVWWASGVAILVLTVVAEVSSISRLIEEVTVLRRFDMWGRGNDGG